MRASKTSNGSGYLRPRRMKLDYPTAMEQGSSVHPQKDVIAVSQNNFKNIRTDIPPQDSIAQRVKTWIRDNPADVSCSQSARTQTEGENEGRLEVAVSEDADHSSGLQSYGEKMGGMVADESMAERSENSFKDPESVREDERIWSGMKELCCTTCKMEFTRRIELRVHNKRRHETKNLIAGSVRMVEGTQLPSTSRPSPAEDYVKADSETDEMPVLQPFMGEFDEDRSSNCLKTSPDPEETQNCNICGSIVPGCLNSLVQHRSVCLANYYGGARWDSTSASRSDNSSPLSSSEKDGRKSCSKGQGKEKRFCCSYCPYQTAKTTDIMRHLRAHTGEQPFKCDLCSFRTSRKDIIMRHQRIKHWI